MNVANAHRILAAALTFAVVCVGTAAAQTTRSDAVANMPFAENRPTKETARHSAMNCSSSVRRRRIFGRCR